MYTPDRKTDWFGIGLLAGAAVASCVLFGIVLQTELQEPAESVQMEIVTDADNHPSIEQEISAATEGMVGSPVQDLRAQYAAAYRRARSIKLTGITHCEGCGITAVALSEDGGELQTHHVRSVEEIFHKHLDPSLISDPDNLIVLCRNGGGECHFHLGHDPDGPSGPASPTWAKSNPNVRRDAARNLKVVSSKSTVAP